MPLKHILILGAGPAGLSAALALSQLSDTPSSTSTDELQITVLELRPEPSTLGGSINLTPLAMRYLDRLGVGARLRPRGVAVRAIDMLSLRTGRLMGSLWPDVDALRARRIDLVSCMLEAIAERKNVSVRFGLRVTEIREEGDVDGEGRIVLALQSGEQIAGDVLLGCDGLHSAARKLHVEPERKEVYSGKAVAYGFVDTPAAEHADVRRADGEPAIRDTALVSGQHGALVLSFYQPSRDSLYLGGVMGMTDEHEGSKEGWRARGGDKSKVREDILARFKGDSIPGFSRLIQKCEDWCLFPVYRLPPNGRWSRGRAILLGDAAHAMPPQGESTGVAIEDGVLVAHVLSRHSTRNIPALFADYDILRRSTIEKLYKTTVWNWENAAGGSPSWSWAMFMEWMTIVALIFMNWRKEDHFAGDVSKLQLPT